jgi:hypothetical protein
MHCVIGSESLQLCLKYMNTRPITHDKSQRTYIKNVFTPYCCMISKAASAHRSIYKAQDSKSDRLEYTLLLSLM